MDLTPALREHFGFESFRRGQREACEAALSERDVMLVMPTGAGKSLCYQLPALVRDDLAVVVSPLVALMQDQVEALAARGLGERVALVNAQQDAERNAAVLERAERGDLSLLYVAPERFSSPGFLERMRRAKVGLFVVDEAHCVSQWGHDFRPDYFRLGDAARFLGARAIFASTATATPRVAADVVRRLALREPLRVVTGFDRPNLSFAVVRAVPQDKRRLLAQALQREEALPAIVYAGTRAGTEEIARELTGELGEEALAYHAGLTRDRRATVQRRFLADEARVIVATNAFGMGIDKPNVRTVAHAAVPSSLEAYYQEAGRAGRDGAPARALLLAEDRDKALHVHFIKRDELSDGAARSVVERLRAAASADGRYAVGLGEVASAAGCSIDALRALVGHLVRAGVVEPAPAAPDRLAGRITAPFDRRALGLWRASVADAVRVRWRQYREVWSYVEGAGCRRLAILRHFGDAAEPAPEGPCCDACDPALVPELTAAPGAARVESISRPEGLESLDEAIVAVATSARPRIGRTTCAEILHGARTKKIARNSYDGLPTYGLAARLRRAEILARIDELIEQGRLETTPGPYPVIEVPGQSAAA